MIAIIERQRRIVWALRKITGDERQLPALSSNCGAAPAACFLLARLSQPVASSGVHDRRAAICAEPFADELLSGNSTLERSGSVPQSRGEFLARSPSTSIRGPHISSN